MISLASEVFVTEQGRVQWDYMCTAPLLPNRTCSGMDMFHPFRNMGSSQHGTKRRACKVVCLGCPVLSSQWCSSGASDTGLLGEPLEMRFPVGRKKGWPAHVPALLRHPLSRRNAGQCAMATNVFAMGCTVQNCTSSIVRDLKFPLLRGCRYWHPGGINTFWHMCRILCRRWKRSYRSLTHCLPLFQR